VTLPEPFDAPFMARALVEVLLLAVLAGVLGTWIVLRRLAFYTHAVGTAAFPGLVLAAAWGVAAPPIALACALGFALAVEALGRARGEDAGTATGLLLVAALATGVILASDVFESGAAVDRLLFGSLIGVTSDDVWLTAAVTAAVIALDAALGRSWLASTFDSGSARSLGVRVAAADRALLAAVAVAVIVALDAVGALLVSVALVLPAATVRLLTDDLRALRAGTIALAAGEGVLALWLAERANAAPGPVLAVLGGGLFALVSAASALRLRRAAVAA
jgi:ABC-type Mn2+/Zn2+ transport system permease subunit